MKKIIMVGVRGECGVRQSLIIKKGEKITKKEYTFIKKGYERRSNED